MTQKWYATLHHPKMHPLIKFGIPTDGTDIVTTIKTKSEVKVKVTVTRKWYATLCHPKMHPYTKFGIPTSKNIGDMHRSRSGTDGQTDSAITICLQMLLWGIKKNDPQNTKRELLGNKSIIYQSLSLI